VIPLLVFAIFLLTFIHGTSDRFGIARVLLWNANREARDAGATWPRWSDRLSTHLREALD
jgi:hypothetical protein